MKYQKSLIVLFVSVFLLITTIPAFAENEKKQSSDLLLLINKEHPLSKEYTPLDRFDLAKSMPASKNSIVMRQEAGQALLALYEAMNQEGLTMSAVSGYRSYHYQTTLYQNETKRQYEKGNSQKKAEEIASTITAPPGASEHQSGLAIDVSNDGTLTESFGQTESGIWLAEHAYQYGYLLRYPNDKQDITKIIYEPWHFRYIGKPHAEYIVKNNLVLEEYLSLLEKEKQLSFSSEDGTDYIIFYTKNPEKNFDHVIDFSRDNRGGYVVTTQPNSDSDSSSTSEKLNGHWAEAEIRSVVPKSLLTLDPDSTLSRAPFAQLFDYSSLEIKRNYPGFPDVSEEDPFFLSIKQAFETDLMDEKNGGFSPQDRITREYAATVISKTIQNDRITRLPFLDTGEISGWAFQDIQKLYALQLLGNQEENLFRPKEEITLAEAAQWIFLTREFQNQAVVNP